MEVPKMFFPVSAFCLHPNACFNFCPRLSAWSVPLLSFRCSTDILFLPFSKYISPSKIVLSHLSIYLYPNLDQMDGLVHFPAPSIITSMSTQIFQHSRNSFFLSPYIRTCIFYLSQSHQNFYFSDEIQKCLKCSFRTHVTFIWTWTIEKPLFF